MVRSWHKTAVLKVNSNVRFSARCKTSDSTRHDGSASVHRDGRQHAARRRDRVSQFVETPGQPCALCNLSAKFWFKLID